VLAAYGRIILQEILDIPVHGALNVHPSLLPKYRGPSPVQSAILAGEETTGVTILLMDKEIDHGPILTNDKLQTTNDKSTYPELHNQLAELGGDLLVQTIPLWVEGKIKPVPQNHSEATYTKLITKEQGIIDWEKPAEYIERQVRAFYPWPGTYTKFEKISKYQILKILKANVLAETQGKPGETFLHNSQLAVYAGKDALVIEELQLEGGKPMSSKEFLLGHRDFIGYVFAAFA
jgi:methionyl-tRNA formyltransferase